MYKLKIILLTMFLIFSVSGCGSSGSGSTVVEQTEETTEDQQQEEQEDQQQEEQDDDQQQEEQDEQADDQQQDEQEEDKQTVEAAFDNTTLLLSEVEATIEDENDIDIYKINLNRAGTMSLYTLGSLDTIGTLYDSEGNVLTTVDDSASGYNFRIDYEVTAGTYYLEVVGYDSRDVGDYVVHLDFESSEILVDDDHGNTILTATELVSQLDGSFEYEGDIDIFRINISQSGTYRFSSTSSEDTIGTLYDNSGYTLTQDDDSGVDYNFSMEYYLDAGIYYLEATSYSGATIGDYVVYKETVSVNDDGGGYATSSLNLELMDVRAAINGLDPLLDNPYRGFNFYLGGYYYSIESDAIDNATTYSELLYAIEEELYFINAIYGNSLSVSITSTFAAYDYETGVVAYGELLTIYDNDGGDFQVDGFILGYDAAAEYNVHASLTEVVN